MNIIGIILHTKLNDINNLDFYNLFDAIERKI